MAGSQLQTSVTILNSLKGFQAVSLTEYNTSAAASIAAGSVVEIAGAFFTFVSDEAIDAASWTAIVTGTTAYITLTPSGTAGSQIVDVAYTATAPTWRDDHQGWYATAASNVRVIGSVYKAEAAIYLNKNTYEGKLPDHGISIFLSSGTFLVPLNAQYVYLTGCAAGGNGGSGATGSAGGGGGGGSGEIIYKKKIYTTPGQAIPITIGAVGAITSFGALNFNFGANGSNGSGTIGGNGGAGGSLTNGSIAGSSGGKGYSSGVSAIIGGSSGYFSYGGGVNSTAGAAYEVTGGGGGGGIGTFANYILQSSAGAGSYAAGVNGNLGGGGGGGGLAISASGGVGGSGGYGSGGGGGGASASGGSGGLGGAGGPAILIVEW
jgi:hypothetical protein